MSMALEKARLRAVPKREHLFAEGWIAVARDNANWLVGLGVVEVVLGVMAVSAPFITGIAASMFVGALLFVAGIVRVVRASKAQSFGQGSLAFFAGLLSISCGLLVFALPQFGLELLTLLLAAYFVTEGISCLILSFKVRPHLGWGWLLLDGIVTSCLAFLIAAAWPVSGVWVLGTLLGIDILISGVAAVSIGWRARRVTIDW